MENELMNGAQVIRPPTGHVCTGPLQTQVGFYLEGYLSSCFNRSASDVANSLASSRVVEVKHLFFYVEQNS